MKLLILLGQAIIGLVFIISVINDYIGRNEFTLRLSAKNIPYLQYVIPGSMGVKVICGLALIFNILAPIGAFLLAVLTLAMTVLLHNFWAFQDEERKVQYAQFLTQIAVVGGLIVVMGS